MPLLIQAIQGLPYRYVLDGASVPQGAYGWKMAPDVKSYRSYEKWDQPPEPEPHQVKV